MVTKPLSVETKSVHAHALNRAAEFCGGRDLLAAYLGVPEEMLERWLAGTVQMPSHLFFKAVDLLANEAMYRIGRNEGEAEAT